MWAMSKFFHGIADALRKPRLAISGNKTAHSSNSTPVAAMTCMEQTGMKCLIAAFLVAACAPVSAQVYKCTVGGQTTFTDKPCHTDAVPIVVRPAAGYASESAGEIRSINAAEFSRTAQRYAIDEQIGRKRNRLIALRQSRDREIATLRAKQGQASDDLTGATLRQSISQEMLAVNSSYDAEMRGVELEIEQLLREQSALK